MMHNSLRCIKNSQNGRKTVPLHGLPVTTAWRYDTSAKKDDQSPNIVERSTQNSPMLVLSLQHKSSMEKCTDN